MCNTVKCDTRRWFLTPLHELSPNPHRFYPLFVCCCVRVLGSGVPAQLSFGFVMGVCCGFAAKKVRPILYLFYDSPMQFIYWRASYSARGECSHLHDRRRVVFVMGMGGGGTSSYLKMLMYRNPYTDCMPATLHVPRQSVAIVRPKAGLNQGHGSVFRKHFESDSPEKTMYGF